MEKDNHSDYFPVQDISITVSCLPSKIASFLCILNFEDVVLKYSSSVGVKLIDFIVGFECGLLLRCKYTSNVDYDERYKKMNHSNKKTSIISKFNRSCDDEEGVTETLGKIFLDKD
jgi:hypothetical protein